MTVSVKPMVLELYKKYNKPILLVIEDYEHYLTVNPIENLDADYIMKVIFVGQSNVLNSTDNLTCINQPVGAYDMIFSDIMDSAEYKEHIDNEMKLCGDKLFRKLILNFLCLFVCIIFLTNYEKPIEDIVVSDNIEQQVSKPSVEIMDDYVLDTPKEPVEELSGEVYSSLVDQIEQMRKPSEYLLPSTETEILVSSLDKEVECSVETDEPENTWTLVDRFVIDNLDTLDTLDSRRV